MPRGKGTYGSQVGRPPKKKYQAGGITGKDDAAVLEAAQMGQELESIPLGGVEPDFPTSNAMDRTQTYQFGGAVMAQSEKQKEEQKLSISMKKARKRIAKRKRKGY